MRRESARQLLTHAQEMLALYRQQGPCAILIAGDMNTSLDDPKFTGDPTLRAFRAAGFHWTHEGVPFASRTTSSLTSTSRAPNQSTMTATPVPTVSVIGIAS